MTQHPDVQRVAQIAEGYLDEIASYFKPGAKLTLLVRRPGAPDQDFMLTTDDLSEAIMALQRRLALGQGERATAAELHNRLAGPIVASIVKPVIASGGTPADVLVLTESVLVGVALAIVRLGGDEPVLDSVFAGARARLAELRLKELRMEGSG